jgi:hypothetical protein
MYRSRRMKMTDSLPIKVEAGDGREDTVNLDVCGARTLLQAVLTAFSPFAKADVVREKLKEVAKSCAEIQQRTYPVQYGKKVKPASIAVQQARQLTEQAMLDLATVQSALSAKIPSGLQMLQRQLATTMKAEPDPDDPPIGVALRDWANLAEKKEWSVRKRKEALLSLATLAMLEYDRLTTETIRTMQQIFDDELLVMDSAGSENETEEDEEDEEEWDD